MVLELHNCAKPASERLIILLTCALIFAFYIFFRLLETDSIQGSIILHLSTTYLLLLTKLSIEHDQNLL